LARGNIFTDSALIRSVLTESALTRSTLTRGEVVTSKPRSLNVQRVLPYLDRKDLNPKKRLDKRE